MPITFFTVERGRFITDTDLLTAARVVVLGTSRATEFFVSDNPVGKTMSINGSGYLVVGVAHALGSPGSAGHLFQRRRDRDADGASA